MALPCSRRCVRFCCHTIIYSFGREKERNMTTSIENIFFYESRGGSSDFRLQTSDLTKFELRISEFLTVETQCCMVRLLTSHLPPPTSYFPIPTSDFRFPTSDFRLRFPTSDFQLSTSNFPLLTFDFRLDSSVRLDFRSIRHAGINAQGQGSV